MGLDFLEIPLNSHNTPSFLWPFPVLYFCSGYTRRFSSGSLWLWFSGFWPILLNFALPLLLLQLLLTSRRRTLKCSLIAVFCFRSFLLFTTRARLPQRCDHGCWYGYGEVGPGGLGFSLTITIRGRGVRLRRRLTNSSTRTKDEEKWQTEAKRWPRARHLRMRKAVGGRRQGSS